MGTSTLAGSLASSGAIPNPSVPDPATAIANGQALFDGAMANGGSAQGVRALMGAAAGIVSGLPAGAFQQAFSAGISDAETLLSGATSGFAIGGPYGAAAGAAVAMISIMVEALSGDNHNVVGDLRSTAEKNVFPARDPNRSYSSDSTLGDGERAQTLIWPYCTPGFRRVTRGFLPLVQTSTNDPSRLVGLRSTIQRAFGTPNFGIGWASPPGSTVQSATAGYSLAQYAMSRWSKNLGIAVADGGQQQWARTVESQAGTALEGGSGGLARALGLLESWYGSRFAFNPSFSLTTGGPPLAPDIGPGEPDGFFYSPGGVDWKTYAGEWVWVIGGLNYQTSLDYTYYFSYSIAALPGVGIGSMSAAWLNAAQTVGTDSNPGASTRFCLPIACPDTSVIALAELACLVVLGVVAADAADLAALHLMLGLQWAWTRGDDLDKAGGSSLSELRQGLPRFTQPHPNFSRILGIIQAKIYAGSPAGKAAAAKARAALPGPFTSGAVGPGSFSHGLSTAAAKPATGEAGTSWASPASYRTPLAASGASPARSAAQPSAGVAKVAIVGAALLAAVWWAR